MPIFRNALAERLIRKQAQSYNISGAIRRARSIDPNNVAASLERQTSRLVGANKSAQGAVAQAITRGSGVRIPGRPNTAYAPGGAAPGTSAQTTNLQNAPGVNNAPGGLVLLSRTVSRKIVGGQVLEITTSIWRRPNGTTFTSQSTRVVGQVPTGTRNLE